MSRSSIEAHEADHLLESFLDERGEHIRILQAQLILMATRSIMSGIGAMATEATRLDHLIQEHHARSSMHGAMMATIQLLLKQLI